MQIEILREDIDTGTFPVTLALKKIYKNVVINYYKTTLDNKTILTPKPILECLYRFDNELPIEPFSFEIK